jgi:decaprenylphospho-beta-D-erythro-pentofuranosid-2-ulose 2-reductase
MIDATGRPQSLLVLGGSSELALAVVARWVPSRTRTVVLAGRPGERLEAAAARVAALGAEVETVAYDTSDPTGAAAVVDRVFDGRDVDLVLAAAGALGSQPALDGDPAGTAELITTNFTGLAASLVAAAARMRQQGHGRLVVFSSVAGERARAANFTYGSTKAGLDAFAQGLGDSLVGTGVGVTVVRPGFVVGRMTEGMEPAPFATTPDAVADAVVAGVARGADVVYAPPVLRVVFAGMKHLPRAVWRRLPG